MHSLFKQLTFGLVVVVVVVVLVVIFVVVVVGFILLLWCPLFFTLCDILNLFSSLKRT